MTIPRRLFLDANVWIAAAGSPTGASAMLLTLCQEERAEAAVTRLVLLEAEKNVRTKFGDAALVRFYRLISAPGLQIVPVPSNQEMAVYANIIHAKDTHVLAGAHKAKANALITLNRQHFWKPSVRQAQLPFEVLTPGEYLRRLLGE